MQYKYGSSVYFRVNAAIAHAIRDYKGDIERIIVTDDKDSIIVTINDLEKKKIEVCL